MECPVCKQPLEHHSFAEARECWNALEPRIGEIRQSLAFNESAQRALSRQMVRAS